MPERPSPPVVLATLRRWREVLAGAALGLGGLWLALSSFGVLRWVAGGIVALGLALAWTGLQRLRFGAGGGGPGVVEVDERRLRYWGPLTGGALDLDDLARLEIDPGARPAHWVLTARDGTRLAVPVDAEGAGALFDVFAALPGLGAEAVLAARGRRAGPPVTLWQAAGPAPAAREGPLRLH